MDKNNNIGFIGIGIIVGLSILGYFMTSAVKTYREFERTVTVRGRFSSLKPVINSPIFIKAWKPVPNAFRIS